MNKGPSFPTALSKNVLSSFWIFVSFIDAECCLNILICILWWRGRLSLFSCLRIVRVCFVWTVCSWLWHYDIKIYMSSQLLTPSPKQGHRNKNFSSLVYSNLPLPFCLEQAIKKFPNLPFLIVDPKNPISKRVLPHTCKGCARETKKNLFRTVLLDLPIQFISIRTHPFCPVTFQLCCPCFSNAGFIKIQKDRVQRAFGEVRTRDSWRLVYLERAWKLHAPSLVPHPRQIFVCIFCNIFIINQ